MWKSAFAEPGHYTSNQISMHIISHKKRITFKGKFYQALSHSIHIFLRTPMLELETKLSTLRTIYCYCKWPSTVPCTHVKKLTVTWKRCARSVFVMYIIIVFFVILRKYIVSFIFLLLSYITLPLQLPPPSLLWGPPLHLPSSSDPILHFPSEKSRGIGNVNQKQQKKLQ